MQQDAAAMTDKLKAPPPSPDPPAADESGPMEVDAVDDAPINAEGPSEPSDGGTSGAKTASVMDTPQAFSPLNLEFWKPLLHSVPREHRGEAKALLKEMAESGKIEVSPFGFLRFGDVRTTIKLPIVFPAIFEPARKPGREAMRFYTLLKKNKIIDRSYKPPSLRAGQDTSKPSKPKAKKAKKLSSFPPAAVMDAPADPSKTIKPQEKPSADFFRLRPRATKK